MDVQHSSSSRDRTQATGVRTFVAGAAAVVVVALTLTGCGSAPGPSPASDIVRSTTNIAGAGVVGAAGRTVPPKCGAPTAPDDVGRQENTRVVGGSGPASVVPADPRRIVVLDTNSLDAACATGVWELVVGAATRQDVITQTPGTRQPAYLGDGIGRIPDMGPVGQPNIDAIIAMRPDLIVGSDALSADVATRLRAVAPTVLTRAASSWTDRALLASTAFGRTIAAEDALTTLRRDAADLGTRLAAPSTEASVVRFEPNSAMTLGPETFAGQVLAMIGARRPQPQRDTSLAVDLAEPRIAEGDLMYVIFAPGAVDSAQRILSSEPWRSLGASSDGRVFSVDDAVWTGEGMSAAQSMLVDLQSTLNGYAPS